MAFTRKDFLRNTALASLSGLLLSNTTGSTSVLEVPGHHKIKPKALKAGDTLGLVAPASPIYEDAVYEQMLTDLKDLGFKLKLGQHIRDRRGYLAGIDAARAQDLMDMFLDDDVDGIMCTRGGWGCNRILPLLNFSEIRKHPKVLCGFSDITSLHMALYRHSDLITFHGPVGKSEWNDFTTRSFKDIIWEGATPLNTIPEDEFDESFTIESGVMQGRLLGGNLSVLVSMMGSNYLPSFKGAILYLEDVGESVYRIDRMLTQLKMAGILNEISGFIFGKCTDCDDGPNSLSLQEVLDDHIKSLHIPAFYGAMISHEERNITIPVGIEAEMNADERTIRILDSAVV